MIRATARARFTAADFDFVVRCLSKKQEDAVNLADLFHDETSRDSILDHELLVQAILSHDPHLSVSPQLYFYVLTRRVLMEAGIDDRDLTDYIASVLVKFMQASNLASPIQRMEGSFTYVSDLLLALRDATPSQTFVLRAHVGNYSLFVTGLFLDNLERRSRRGAPDPEFYEEMGQMNYRLIAKMPQARQCHLVQVYEQLGQRFHQIRLALNTLAERLIHIDDTPHPPALR